MQLGSGFYTYNTMESKFKQLRHRIIHLGSCYIKLNSTHFIQTGGYKRWNGKLLGVYTDVFMIVAQTSHVTSRPIWMVNIHMPSLLTARRYHGCGMAKMQNTVRIMVAGGTNNNSLIMRSIEYLDLNMNGHGQIMEEQWKNSKWQAFPPLKIPRTDYPSVVQVRNQILIAGGNCGPAHTPDCTLIERYNSLSGTWDIDEHRRLNHSRYKHNTFQVPTKYC